MKLTAVTGRVELDLGADVDTFHDLPTPSDFLSPTVAVHATWEINNPYSQTYELCDLTVRGTIMQLERFAMAILRETQTAETALMAQAANTNSTFDDGENW